MEVINFDQNQIERLDLAVFNGKYDYKCKIIFNHTPIYINSNNQIGYIFKYENNEKWNDYFRTCTKQIQFKHEEER